MSVYRWGERFNESYEKRDRYTIENVFKRKQAGAELGQAQYKFQ